MVGPGNGCRKLGFEQKGLSFLKDIGYPKLSVGHPKPEGLYIYTVNMYIFRFSNCTPPKFNIACSRKVTGWLEDEFPFGAKCRFQR